MKEIFEKAGTVADLKKEQNRAMLWDLFDGKDCDWSYRSRS